MATAYRAVGRYDYCPKTRNPDWLAEHFLSSQDRQLLAEDQSILALGMDIREVEKLTPALSLVSPSYARDSVMSGCRRRLPMELGRS